MQAAMPSGHGRLQNRSVRSDATASKPPQYGIRRGGRGYLLNAFSSRPLPAQAETTRVHALCAGGQNLFSGSPCQAALLATVCQARQFRPFCGLCRQSPLLCGTDPASAMSVCARRFDSGRLYPDGAPWPRGTALHLPGSGPGLPCILHQQRAAPRAYNLRLHRTALDARHTLREGNGTCLFCNANRQSKFLPFRGTAMRDTATTLDAATRRKGALALLGVFVGWGFMPMYWMLLRHISAVEILSYRSIYAFGWALLILFLAREGTLLRDGLRIKANWIYIGLGSCLHMCIWFLYVWGTTSEHILDVGLGQYIQPLASILAGVLVFRQRLSRLKAIAAGVAACGVLIMSLLYGVIPWLALSIGVMSAFFPALRKQAPASVLPGMVMEMGFNSLTGLVILLWMAEGDATALFNYDSTTLWLLVGAGFLTAIPQSIYVYGLQRSTMLTLGFMQYTMPTVTVIVGVTFGGEVLSQAKLTGFVFVWIALVLYGIDQFRTVRQAQHAAHPADRRHAS